MSSKVKSISWDSPFNVNSLLCFYYSSAPRLWLLPAVVPSPVPGSQRRRDSASAAALHLALPRMHQEASLTGELCCSFHRCSGRWWDALNRAADGTAATCLSAENRPDRRLCEQSQTIAVSGVAAKYKEGQIGTEKVRYGMVLFSCLEVNFFL